MSSETSQLNTWLPRARSQGNSAALRLLCFPSGGRGARSYESWSEATPDAISILAVQLPGREERVLSPPFTRFPKLIPKLAKALSPHLVGEFALFGHSLGALIAYELARHLSREAIHPKLLAVAALPAPHLKRLRPRVSHLAEGPFRATLRKNFDLAPSISESVELFSLVSATLRADFALLENYVHSEEPPLTCPISAFGATDDREAAFEEIEAWRQHTTGRFKHRTYEGGHFFIDSSEAEVLAALTEDLL